MSELSLILTNLITHDTALVTWLVAIFILAIGVFLQRVWVKEYIGEWKLNRLLINTGVKSLHNVSIAGYMGENVFIEHLILSPNNIILLNVKKISGLIFAAKKIDMWTQVVGNKSYKFENPLHQLENDVITLNSKIENAEVVGKVLFTKGSEFPKGKPDDVVAISDVKNWSLEFAGKDVPPRLLNTWEQLGELVKNNALDEDILIKNNQLSGVNVASLVTTATLIFLWLVWRL